MVSIIALCLELGLLATRPAALKACIGLLDSCYPGIKLWKGLQRQAATTLEKLYCCFKVATHCVMV